MSDAGNPLDWSISNKHRDKLWAGYMELMKQIRAELDKQGEKDNSHYMLTIASPSSGYLLRGFEGFQALPYLDFVNMMTYDLHGAWNNFVGHNAPLYDTGTDVEIEDAKIYDLAGDGKYYNAQGYLNIDWSYQYFRNALQGGRINIGLPYYTRGWQQVEGGTNGLWGSALLPDQTKCNLGTGNNMGPDALTPQKDVQQCGFGAQGIDNLWFDPDFDGNEIMSGSNPMWHANNLRDNLPTPYVEVYGHSPENPASQYTGDYVEHYDDVAKGSYLWNQEKKVFLSTENEQSFMAKVQYAIDSGAGGIMFWEMAGDYSKPEDNGLGYHYFGRTLTDMAYNAIRSATPMSMTVGSEDFVDPATALDVEIDLVDFYGKGEDNYPLQPLLKITNNSDVDLSGGKVAFNVTAAVPVHPTLDAVSMLRPWRGANDYTVSGAANVDDLTYSILERASSVTGNVGGLPKATSRIEIDFGAKSNKVQLKPGATAYLPFKYFMPMPVPTDFTFTTRAGVEFGRLSENPAATTTDKVTCDMMNIVRGQHPTYVQKYGVGKGTINEYMGAVYLANVWNNDLPTASSWDKLCDFK